MVDGVQRRPARVQSVAPAAAPEDDSWMGRGGSGFQRNRQVQNEREQRRNTPRVRGFSCRKGETRELIVLDARIEDVRFVWEHAIPGENNNWKQARDVLCPREFANCAVCERAEMGGKGSRFRMPYYCMKLSVMDISGFIDPETNEHVAQPFRRLLTVKSEQINDFEKLFTACMKMHGTIRGMYLIMSRDHGDTSPRIGKPTVHDNGMMFQLFTEQQLVQEFGHPAIMKEGTNEVRVPANGYLQPFEYAKILPKPNPDEIRRVWGGGPAVGSSASNEEAWADEDEGAEYQDQGGTYGDDIDEGEGLDDTVGDHDAGAATIEAERQVAAPTRAAPATRERVRPATTQAQAPTRERIRPAPAAAPAAASTPSRPPQGTREGVVRRRSVASGDNIPF